MSWVYWQVGGPGPFFGQLLAFARQEPRNPAAFEKFFGESKRLVGVLDGRLRDRQWIAGDYSIADMMSYPWFAAVAELHADVLEGGGPREAVDGRDGRASGGAEGHELRALSGRAKSRPKSSRT